MMQITPVVKQILILNILVYILSQVVPNSYDMLALHYFESDQFRIWQPLTHMFMHARPQESLMHIIFNMFALVSFGSALEHFWGGKRFVFFYLICGLGAAFAQSAFNYYEIHSLVHQLGVSSADFDTLCSINFSKIADANGNINNDLLNKYKFTQENFNQFSALNGSCVGASGAIYGLLVAYAFMFPLAEMMMIFIPFPVKAKYFVPGLVIMDLLSGFTGFKLFSGGNIAHFAHVGGALTGFTLIMLWKNKKFKFNRLN